MNVPFLILAQAESPPVVPGGGDGPAISPGVPGTPAAPGPGAPVATGTAGTSTSGAPLGPNTPPPSGPSPWFLFLMLGAVALMFLLPARAQKKERKKMEEMLKALKKGDKVVTSGGIIGHIVEVRDDEVTLKVDDDTRIRFTRFAIQRVVEQKADTSTST